MSSGEKFTVKCIETDKGEPRWQVAGRKPDGTRVRIRFKTEEEAVGKKSELEIEALNLHDSFRLRRTRLTEEQLIEAESAFQKLNGFSLTTAVEFALGHYRAPIVHVSVEEATKRFVCEKTQSQRRKRTMGEYRKEFAHLNGLHGERLVSDIRSDDLSPLVYKKSAQAAVTTNHHIERLHAFFAWCVRKRYCLENPVTFEKATADEQEPEILGNDAVKRLLWAAMNFKDGMMVPYFALSLFTGMRPDELCRIPLEVAVQHQDQVINLEGVFAKGRRSRLVEVQKNLPQWTAFRPGVPIVAPNFRKHFDRVRELAGFRVGKHRHESNRPAWTPDVLRHTALSNYFAVTKGEKDTARWAGNSPETLHKHYRRNVIPTAAADYWTITPQSLQAEFGTAKAA